MRFKYLYQFKITLEDIDPPIWRRIQVPRPFTFWDLHTAIQDSMGWNDEHLHHFEITNPKTGLIEKIGAHDDEDRDSFELPGWEFKIKKYFSKSNPTCRYLYDYGDNWWHDIIFEGEHVRKPDTQYPICLAGERSCPPENCGGTPGYEQLLEIIFDPKHKRYKEYFDWLGYFNPEGFDIEKIHFVEVKRTISKQEKREILRDIGASYWPNSGWYIYDSGDLLFLGNDAEKAYEVIIKDFYVTQKVADIERRLKEHEGEEIKIVTGIAKECAENYYIVSGNVIDFSLLKIRTLFENNKITIAGRVDGNKIVAYGYIHHDAISDENDISFFCDDLAKRIKASKALDSIKQ